MAEEDIRKEYSWGSWLAPLRSLRLYCIGQCLLVYLKPFYLNVKNMEMSKKPNAFPLRSYRTWVVYHWIVTEWNLLSMLIMIHLLAGAQSLNQNRSLLCWGFYKPGGVWFDPYRKHITLEVCLLYCFVQFPCKEPLINIIKPDSSLIHSILWKSHSYPYSLFRGCFFCHIENRSIFFFEIDALLAIVRHA